MTGKYWRLGNNGTKVKRVRLCRMMSLVNAGRERLLKMNNADARNEMRML